MGFTERTEVYWRNGQICPIKVSRPSGYGQWPIPHDYLNSELVATLSGKEGDFCYEEGPKATMDRLEKAVLHHLGIPPDDLSSTAWEEVPDTLLNRVSKIIENAEKKISKQWKQYSNEEALTGALFSHMVGNRSYKGWDIDVQFVEFSKQAKEPATGTDIAIILDVKTADGRRSFKTMWMQAKRDSRVPDNIASLPRFAKQAADAKNFTDDFYGIVYTPQGIFVTGSSSSGTIELHSMIKEAMRCHYGDKSVRTLMNSLNRKHVFEIRLNED